MKPALLAICAISACQPAFADTAQVKESICTQAANLAYIGVEDGIEMYSIIDGADEAITAANGGGDVWSERMAVSSYLSGYSVGLLQTTEPADFAEWFYAVCMAETI